MSKPTIVKFTKPWNGYGPSELAGFPAEKAEQLVEAGVAELAGKVKAGARQQAAQQQPQPAAQQVADGAADAQNEDADEKP
jgi:hypothetical protein